MTRFIFLLLILLAACQPDDTPTETPTLVYDNIYAFDEGCFVTHWAESIGITVGQQAQVIDQFATLWLRDEPFGDRTDSSLEFLEIVEVVDGPQCWQLYPSTSTALITEDRRWKVRSTTRDVEGWIDEYGRSIMGVNYQIMPINDDSPPITAGKPLSEPVQIAGNVGQLTTHSITFEDYGYVTGYIEVDKAGCLPRVFMLVTPNLSYRPSGWKVTVYLKDDGMEVANNFVDALFVSAGIYGIQVQPNTSESYSDAMYTITVE